MSIGTVVFSRIYGIKDLPVNHVAMEFVDLQTKKSVTFEHPPNKNFVKPKIIENRVIIGKSKYNVSELQNIISKRRVYIPGVYDCRNYALHVFHISQLHNYNDIKTSIKKGKYS